MLNEKAAANKRAVKTLLDAVADSPATQTADAVAAAYHPDAEWRGSHPLNEMRGAGNIAAQVWQPIKAAMPDAERRDFLLVSGSWDGQDYVGAVGVVAATFAADWLGIPATGGAVYLRYGEYHQVTDGKIMQSTVIFDILDFIRQAGFWPLPPSLGAEEMWAPPISGDGLDLQPRREDDSARSLKMVLDMHAIINTYDDVKDCSREALMTMPQKHCWHKNMMWYGPAGIGTCRGLAGFVDIHQRPFRLAFPNRKAVGHYVRIGDGNYAATGGWPSVSAVHSGGNFVGLPASNKPVTMRVMDFYLCDDTLIRENWVPLDMLDLLLQMDVDVFDRMRQIGFCK